jgi:ubiquinone/menaquinone biosynthesis C-methylase UbiE
VPAPAALWRTYFSLESGAWRRRGRVPAYSARTEGIVDWLADHVPVPGPIVDLGCGIGNFALAFARRGYDVTGIDFAPGMIATAEKAALDEGVSSARFMRADLARPLDLASSAFGGAFCSFVIQFMKEPATFLAEVRRVLRPGGRFLILAPSTDVDRWAGDGYMTRCWRMRRAMGRIPGFIRAYTADGLRGEVTGAGFEVVDYRRYPGGHAVMARAVG